MYCANCGVKLADTEKVCPLCGIRAYHPDLTRPCIAPTYPSERMPAKQLRSRLLQIIVTALFLLIVGILFLCDFQFDHVIAWAHYAAGGMLILYVAAVLPSWFDKPHPIIFVPCVFAAVLLYLLMIVLCTGGRWFLPFALPVTGGLAAIVTTVTVLAVTLRRGRLFVFGGMCLALGAYTVLVEWLLKVSFSLPMIGWSLYPLITFAVIGGLLIFLGICRPARQTMERKFFV